MKTIIFYSYKGGTGRTTATANIAAALAKANKKILCVDLDIEGPGLHLVFGEGEEVPRSNIVEFLKTPSDFDWSQITDIGNKWRLPHCLFLLPSPMNLTKDEFVDTAGTDAVNKLKILKKKAEEENFDYLIIDSSSGFTDLSALSFSIADYILVLFKWSRQHLIGTRKTATLLTHIMEKKIYPLQAFELIPSAVAEAESDFEKERKRVVSQTFKDKLGKDIRFLIRENPRLKWEESVIIFTDPELDRYIYEGQKVRLLIQDFEAITKNLILKEFI